MSRAKVTAVLTTCAVGVLLGALFLRAQVPSPALLVLEKGTLTLAIIDPTSLQVVARVPSGLDPHEVIASDDGGYAYISNYGGDGGSLNTISVVDLVGRRALPPIDLGALRSAHGLDFAGGKLYFTAETSKVIGRYDPAAHQVDWVLGTGQDRTHMILVSRNLERIVTSNVNSGTISIIEEVTQAGGGPPPGGPGRNGANPGASPPGQAGAPGQQRAPRKTWEVTSVPSGRGSEGFDVSPDAREIWAANAQDGTVTIIDVSSKKAIDTVPIPVRGANRLKITPDGKLAFVSGGGGPPGAGGDADSAQVNLAILDVRTRKVVKTLSLGGGSEGILMDPDGSRAFVAVNQADKVAVVDTRTLTVTGQVSGVMKPDGMAWSPKK